MTPALTRPLKARTAYPPMAAIKAGGKMKTKDSYCAASAGSFQWKTAITAAMSGSAAAREA